MTSVRFKDNDRSSGSLYVCLPVAPVAHQSVRCVPSKKAGGRPRFYCPQHVVDYKKSIKDLLSEGLSSCLEDKSIPLIPSTSKVHIDKVSFG